MPFRLLRFIGEDLGYGRTGLATFGSYANPGWNFVKVVGVHRISLVMFQAENVGWQIDTAGMHLWQ